MNPENINSTFFYLKVEAEEEIGCGFYTSNFFLLQLQNFNTYFFLPTELAKNENILCYQQVIQNAFSILMHVGIFFT